MTDLHDRGDAAYELASAAVAEVESLRAEHERYRGLLAIERATVEQVMLTQRSEKALLEAKLATISAALSRACSIASEWIDIGPPGIETIKDVARDEIADLRKAGMP